MAAESETTQNGVQLEGSPQLQTLGVERATSEYERAVILVLDESFASQHALRWTLKNFLRVSDNELFVLAIVKDDKPDDEMNPQVLLEKYASFTVDHFKGRQDENKLSIKGLVIRGDVRENLVKKAEKMKATTIIMGFTGRESYNANMGKALQDYISQHTSIPLVLIRSPLPKKSIHPGQSPPVTTKDAAAGEKPQAPRMNQGQQRQEFSQYTGYDKSYSGGELPRDYAIKAEVDANPEWFQTTDSMSMHPKKKLAKTPERYLRIRNFILDEWIKDTSRFLTKTSARRGLLQREGDVNAIGRVFDFLQHNGYINCNMTKPPLVTERKRKASVISNGTSIDMGRDFDKLPKIESPWSSGLKVTPEEEVEEGQTQTETQQMQKTEE